MIPAYQPQQKERQRFPRVSGDDPETIHGNGAQFMFSPRERG